MSTLEANKALVGRFVEEFWSKGNLAAAAELMTPDVIIYATIYAPDVSDIAGLKALNTVVRTAFPDWYSTPEELIAEGDRVAERWTGRGTHRGEFQGIAPTGRQVAVPGVVFYRIRDSKIAEFRGSWDALGLLQQLGAAPVPAPAAR
ncbi:MAG: ester cyclase [Dehalococcoidia bacterium]